MNYSYAIVTTGGKQYRVRTGQVINAELMHVEKGTEVELGQVLLISDGEELIIGSPKVEGAKVIATCLEEGKVR
jgi:large subunit ribosomal protein L21